MLRFFLIALCCMIIVSASCTGASEPIESVSPGETVLPEPPPTNEPPAESGEPEHPAVREEYIIDLDTTGMYTGENAYTKDLITIEEWTGDRDMILVFNSNRSPMVVNFGYNSTSQIKTSFQVSYRDEEMDRIFKEGVYTVLFNGNVIESTGRIELNVTASGCDWWIKIGVE